MLTEPLKILRDKVPFVEFAWRTGKLMLNPKVESIDDFKTGDSRYALWDIMLALSFIAVVFSLGYAFTGDEYYQSAQKLLTQTNITFSLLYYTIPTLISFTLLVFVWYWIKGNLKSASDNSVVCSMLFARVYALFLLIMTLLIIWSVDLLSTELVSIEEYFNNNLLHGFLFLLIGIVLLFWWLLIPLKKYIFPEYRKRFAYPALILVVSLSTELNQHIGSPVKLKFESAFSCKKAYKSLRFANLSDVQKQQFIKNCSTSNWNENKV